MNYKSFVDVLFILLLGTIVMLAHSVSIGAVDTELLKLGGGGVSDVRAETVEVIVIDHEVVWHDDRAWHDATALAAALPDDAVVLLIGADGDVRYHRVMTVWSALAERGLDARLGAAPGDGDEIPEER